MERVTKKFASIHWKGWWGDWIDVRFYLCSNLGVLKGKRVLDVACGMGVVSSEIPSWNEKHALEVDEESIKLAKQLNPGLKLRKESVLKKFPYSSNYFDVVICAHVIPGSDFSVRGDKARVRRKFISEVKRVLKRGGKLYLTTPNGHYYSKYLGNNSKLFREELEELLNGFEFSVREWNPFLPFPRFLPTRIMARIPGIMLYLERRMERKGSGKAFYVEALKKN